MVGKPVSERTRSKKLTTLEREKIKSPKKVGNTSTASSSTIEGAKKKSRKTDESDIAVVPSSSPEPESDDDLDEVQVGTAEESQKGHSSGKKNRATKNGADKNNVIGIMRAGEKPDKKTKTKQKVNEFSPEKAEGKKEGKKMQKNDEEEDVVILGVEYIIGENRVQSEGNEENKKFKAKEVVAKSRENSKKGSGAKMLPEGKNDDKKKKVEGEKEKTGKKRNGDDPPEGNNDNKKKKGEGEKDRTGKRRNDGEEEDKKRKKANKRQKTETEGAKKQANETSSQRSEGLKKEKKQVDKKQKKKVEVEEKKKDNKVQRKKNKEREIEMEEENEKNNSVLYKFPMAQVSRIIKSGDLNAKIAQEAVFVINKAAEKFLELFCREAYACAFLDHKNHVAYDHLSSVVSKRRRFDFLSDFVPEKVKAEDALAEMSKAEAERESET